MDGAELKRDTIPFVPRAQSAGVEPPLQIAMNPFVAGMSGSRMGRPLQTAFGEVIRQIGEQTSVVVVVGSAGTGKSMLIDMAARACVGMGLSVRRIERGDLVHTAFGERSDVLLVDQTDSISNSSLQTLLSATGKSIATTMVFLCLPSCVSRFSFSGTQAAVVELTPLSLSDARNYLQERATSIGRPNLFSSEALDFVIDGSRGLPRMLRSIAQLAFFAAASEGASQVSANHVSNAIASQGTHDGQNADIEVAEKDVRNTDENQRVSIKAALEVAVPRVAEIPNPASVALVPRVVETPKVEPAKTSNIDATTKVTSHRLAEPTVPRPSLENQNSIADIAAHVRFATQKREPASVVAQTGARAPVEALSPNAAHVVAPVPAPSVAAPTTTLTLATNLRATEQQTRFPAAPTPTSGPSLRGSEQQAKPLAAPATTPNLRASEQQARPLAAARAENSREKEGQWISRSVVIGGALAASFVAAGVISFGLMSGGSSSAKHAPEVAAISKPADLAKAVVQAPVAEKPVDSTIAVQATDRAQTRDDAIANLIAKAPATSEPAVSKEAPPPEQKPEAVAKTRVAAPVVNQPSRAAKAVEEAAARKLAEEKARAEREIAEQMVAAQAVAERAAQEKAAADRAIAADRAAQEKIAADKAAADRAKAAELAAVQAQETAKLAQEQQAARTAKLAKDAADKAVKEAADKARAEKIAEEQAKAARQESNRVFSHSLFGFNR